MNRGPADRAGLAVRDLAGRVDPVVPGDRVDLDRVVRGLADLVVRVGRGPVDLAVRHPVDLADQADIRDRAGLAVRDLVGPVDLDLVDLDRVDQADIRDRAGRVAPVGLADLDLVGLVGPADLTNIKAPVGLADLDLAGRENLGDRGMNRVGRVDQAGLADRVDLVDLVARQCVVRLDRQQRRGRPRVISTGVAPRWAAPGMCRTASARPATVRRLRRHNADGAGMTDLRPEGRRLGGTGRRPRVGGAVLRLPVVGTAHGTGRTAT
jgi:hypothetical protein